MPTANLMPDNKSLAIGGVKLNYTIHPFLSGIVLMLRKNCKGVFFRLFLSFNIFNNTHRQSSLLEIEEKACVD